MKKSSALYTIRWAVHKVMNRDMAYLPRRISYGLKKRLEDWIYGKLLSFRKKEILEQLNKDTNCVDSKLLAAGSARFHFDAKDIPAIIDTIPLEEKEQTIRAADLILENKLVFKGSNVILMDEIDWEFSPKNASGWRWELNRQFFYTKLGFAFWYTNNKKYLNKFIETAESWISWYGHKIGKIQWDHPFEVAARINAFIWAYHLFFSIDEWEAKDKARFLQTLFHLSEYLYRVIEYHNPGNHIILEAKALATVALLFPDHPKAAKWAKKGWRIIGRELKKQICDDGVHAERSTMYHMIVAGELAELALLCQENRVSDHGLNEVVMRMSEFIRHSICRVDIPPLFGDAYLTDSYYRFWAPLLSAAINGRPAVYEAQYMVPIEQSMWTIWASQKSRFYCGYENGPAPEIGSKAFPEGGYYISRCGSKSGSLLIWDCGPIGYSANPYHGHNDLLSFIFAYEGTTFFCDSGNDERSARTSRFLRDASAHNTITIDGRGPAKLMPLGNRFEIWKEPEIHLESWKSNDNYDLMIGCHNGFIQQGLLCHHMRILLAMKNEYWLLYDYVGGKGYREICQRFHLSPGVSVGKTERKSWRMEKDSKSIEMHYAWAKQGYIKEYKSLLTKSPAEIYPNQLIERNLIINRCQGNLPMHLCALISPAVDGLENRFMDVYIANENKVIINLKYRDSLDNIEIDLPISETRSKKKEWRITPKVTISRNLTSLSAIGEKYL